MMRGFNDSAEPVRLNLDPVVTTVLGLAAGTPINIDSATAEASDYGILATVGSTRYFVPWAKVYMIRQDQPVPVIPPVQPVVIVPAADPKPVTD